LWGKISPRRGLYIREKPLLENPLIPKTVVIWGGRFCVKNPKTPSQKTPKIGGKKGPFFVSRGV